MIEAWLSASEMTASSGPSSASKRPPFASKQEPKRIVSSVPRNSREPLLELLVQRLGAADEAHRRHPEAAALERVARRLDHGRMVGESQVVVGTQVEQRPHALDLDVRRLRRGEHELALVEARLPEPVELIHELLLERSVHGAFSFRDGLAPIPYGMSVQSSITLPEPPEAATANPSSKSRYENRCVITGPMSRPACTITDIWYQVSYISRP